VPDRGAEADRTVRAQNGERRTPNPEQDFTLNPRILILLFRSSTTHR
jgi:hypothetical protein